MATFFVTHGYIPNIKGCSPSYSTKIVLFPPTNLNQKTFLENCPEYIF
jgi:hypothetical protein